MTSGIGLSTVDGNTAIKRTLRSDWAEKYPVVDLILRQDGMFATIVTSFSVLCGIVSIPLTMRPMHYLRLCARKVLGRTGLRPYVSRYPKFSLAGCQVGALVLSSDWMAPSGWSSPLLGILVTAILWLADLSILLYALEALSSSNYPWTLKRIARRVRRKWPERWFAARMRNPLDAHFVREAILSTAVMVPAWVILFQGGWPYVGNFMFFIVSFQANAIRQENLDHTNMHNRLFRWKQNATRFTRSVFRLTNIYIECILNPLCLRAPFIYAIQHLYVHHVEDNGLDDIQSTVLYDRCSFIDFCKFSFFLTLDYNAGVMTIAYLKKKRRYRPINIVVGGFALWYGAAVGLWLLNPVATTFVLIYKFAINFCSSFGSFAWHGFADPDDPENVFRTAINVVSFQDNHDFFGNNSHIEHHLRPGRHWSKMARSAAENADEYMRQGALQWHFGPFYFTGEKIMKAIWLNRLEALLPLFAGWSGSVPDQETLLKVMRERTRPVFPVPRSARYRWLDRKLGILASRYLIVGKLPPKNWNLVLPSWRLKVGASTA